MIRDGRLYTRASRDIKVKSWLVGLRPRRISPVTGFVFAAHDDPFRVPAQTRSHDSRAISQSQPAASFARLIRFGSMQQQVAVDGNFTGIQFIIYRLSKSLSARNSLVQNIRLRRFHSACRSDGPGGANQE